jgi:zinc transport system substrate-binding protein
MHQPHEPRPISTRALLSVLLLGCLSLAARAQAAPKVVVSIAPLDSLVAAVMEGVGRPDLLVPPGASHHTYTLRPSDMRSLYDADLIIWIGRPLERFLIRPLAALDQTTTRMAVTQMPGIKLLPVRQGGVWSSMDNTRATQAIDPHLWLGPNNASVIVRQVAASLASVDAANAKRYRSNANRTLRRLRALDTALKRKLEPIKHVPYVVFHDAYHYFERRYGLHAVGAITIDPDLSPGARRILQIRELIAAQHVRCVFREPPFEPALVQTVLENSNARRGVLDPIGTDIPPGPDGYFKLMNRLAHSLVKCLDQR